MRLPNADAAKLAVDKLRDYCLNPEHPRGKHKARLFRAALGMSRDDADELKSLLLAAARGEAAAALQVDRWGHYWRVDAPIRRQVATLW